MELYWETVHPMSYVAHDRLALLEMRVTLARLIWEYDVELNESGQVKPIYDHLSLSAGQWEVRLKRVRD